MQKNQVSHGKACSAQYGYSHKTHAFLAHAAVSLELRGHLVGYEVAAHTYVGRSADVPSREIPHATTCFPRNAPLTPGKG
jgi:hypothetical protein